MVNPPLASTAVGVVAPQRSGMASGVNTTFRQIGIATGIAAYGSIFASSLRHKMDRPWPVRRRCIDSCPRWSPTFNRARRGKPSTPCPDRCEGTLVAAIHSSFASTLDLLLVVSAVLALVGAVCSLTMIRSRDFVVSHHPQPPSVAAEPVGSPA